MADHHSSGTDPNFVNDRAYETRDVVLTTLVKWLAFLFVFVAFAAFASYGLYLYFVPRGDVSASAYPLPRVRALPRAPVLQANPVQDIKDYRRDEDAVLLHYGRDAKTGALHIPLDRAVDLVAQEGLPTRANAPLPDTQEPYEPSRTTGQAQTQAEANTGNPAGGEPSNMSRPTPNAPGPPGNPTIPGGPTTGSGGFSANNDVKGN